MIQGVKKFTDDFTKRDTVVVIGGTNNSIWNGVELGGHWLVLGFYSIQQKNLIMETIPLRHDKPEMYDKANYLNDRIKE